jgi:hypothetical protein
MNINILKKHLVGRPVAFTTTDLSKIYRGEISDVIEDEKFHGGSLILVATNANFVHVRAFGFVDGILHCFKPSDTAETSEPMCEEPIIDGAIPFGDLMKRVILPEEKEASRPPAGPSIQDLITKHGTFTGCQELVDRFTAEGSIRKEGRLLHVSMDISTQVGCMCGLTRRVEKFESLTRDLLRYFDADEIVWHTKRGAGNTAIVQVEPGHQGSIDSLPGSFKGDSLCGTLPVIKGIPMRWEHDAAA